MKSNPGAKNEQFYKLIEFFGQIFEHYKDDLKFLCGSYQDLLNNFSDQLERELRFKMIHSLVLLSLVLDARACHCLRLLISDFPRYPLQLNLGLQRTQAATNESRYLSTMRQMGKVEAFLSELGGLLKI